MDQPNTDRKLHYAFNLSKVGINKTALSSPIALNGLNFRIKLKLTESPFVKFIGVFLECIPDPLNFKPKAWSCFLKEATCRFLGTLPRHTFQRRFASTTFSQNKTAWGLTCIMAWAELCDPRFMKNDHVHIEIQFKVDPPVRRDLSNKELELSGVPHLITDLLALYQSKEGADVVLKSRDGQEFPCHRVILSARSNVFRAMLQHDMREKAEGVVTIGNMGGKSLGLLCHYLYSGNLAGAEQDMKLDLEVFKELVRAGDMYGLVNLCKLAAQGLLLRRTAGNALEILAFLKLFGKECLAEPLSYIKEFVTHNVRQIVNE